MDEGRLREIEGWIQECALRSEEAWELAAEIRRMRTGMCAVITELESYMKCNKGKYVEPGWLRLVRDMARKLLELKE